MLGMVALSRRVGLALLLCSIVMGCRPPAAKVLDRPGVRERLTFTTALGRELYRRSMLTWWAAQCVRANISSEQWATEVAGIVIDEAHPETDVLFFDEEGRIDWVVHCEGEGDETCRAEVPSSPTTVSERDMAEYRAVTTAWEHPGFERTTEMYQPVVIPAGEGPDVDFWVYLIALNPNPDMVVLGQHYRFVVDAEGRTVKSFRPFAEGGGGIIDITPSSDLPEGARALSISVWHPLDEVPTEMHVWLALYHTLDLVVTADVESERGGPPVLWLVDYNGNIAPLD
jgi:hypothetical protein